MLLSNATDPDYQRREAEAMQRLGVSHADIDAALRAAVRSYMARPRLCIGTKRGHNYGVVYDSAGVVIGRVFRDSKTARAALGGGRQSFWTANVILDGVEGGPSLGTRHLSRWSAARAIAAFYESYPASSLRAEAKRRASFAPHWSGLYKNTATTAEWQYAYGVRSALAVVGVFKRQNLAVCGLAR